MGCGYVALTGSLTRELLPTSLSNCSVSSRGNPKKSPRTSPKESPLVNHEIIFLGMFFRGVFGDVFWKRSLEIFFKDC
jgi:hypothetical protein